MAFENQQITIQLESTDLTVTPGSRVDVPLLLSNQSPADRHFALTVSGIPSPWVMVPSPEIRLAAGEQRQVLLTFQPPSPPAGRIGRYQVVIRLTDQVAPSQAAEVVCTLTVAELEVPGRVGILLAATELQVAPGQSVALPLVLFNQGLEADNVSLSVEGIPSGWVSASSPSVLLTPGQQQEVTLTIRPTPSAESGAGRHSFKILVASRTDPSQVTAAECVLVIAGFSQFSSDLRPQRIEAGAPARVTVENRGNVEQLFTLTWQSPNDELDFEPLATQQLSILPGDVAMAEFSARPRSRQIFGGERALPFTTHVQATGGGTQNLTGEVVGKPLIPIWVPVAVLVLLLACVCLTVTGVGVLGILDGAQIESPAATELPPEQPTQPLPEQPTEPPPEQPTEPAPEQPTQPPPEQPTQPPPEQPTEPPPEQPTEPPPEQPTEPPQAEATEPPSAEQLPAEPGASGLPCIPLAGGLILAPLLVAAIKSDKRRNSNG